jgi:serine/threonine protein kinase
VARLKGAADEAAATASASAPVTPPSHPEHVGPYKILEKIGEGGMGTVYLAEQREPLRRVVALKIIKPGMDSKAVIARFEAERQALALMNHPNVAKVFSGGSTERGLPYFVMEYVKGDRITEHCDRQKLRISERLALFRTVCDAVQHAHQKGVIHRDIKPSNVLVSVENGEATVKVIDFGVAKAISQPLTEHTLFTERGQLIGTPEYMSPEQAEMSGQDVDTRTDIYSLGVLLYELLVGGLPFDSTALRKAAIDEIRRLIRDVDPVRPSTRLSSVASTEGSDAVSIVERRNTDMSTLRRQLRGDLDWITMKALEKDRTRRYETANQLSLEVSRYLNNEPIHAGPPSRTYRMRKFVRRNRGAVLSVSLVGIALVLGLVGTSMGFYEAEEKRKQVDVAREEALLVADYLAETLLDVYAEVSQGCTASVGEVIERSASKIDAKYTQQIGVRARLKATVGNTYVVLGLYSDAEPYLREALELRREIHSTPHKDLAYTLFHLGILLWNANKLDEAEPVLLEALEMYEDMGLADSVSGYGETLNAVGNVCRGTKKYAEAADAFRKCLRVLKAELGDNNPAVAIVSHNLAQVLHAERKCEEAEARFKEAIAVYRSVDPQGRDLINLLNSLAFLVLNYKGDCAQATELLNEAKERGSAIFGHEHPRLHAILANLASAELMCGDFERARDTATAALQISEAAYGDNDSNTVARLYNLGDVESARCNFAEAAKWYSRASSGLEDDVEKRAQVRIREIYATFKVDSSCGQFEEALGLLEIRRQVVSTEHPENLADNLDRVVKLSAECGNSERAMKLAEESLQLREETLSSGHPDIARSHLGLGMLCVRMGRMLDAKRSLESAIEVAQVQLTPDHPIPAAARCLLAQLVLDNGNVAQFEASDFHNEISVENEDCMLHECLDTLSRRVRHSGE